MHVHRSGLVQHQLIVFVAMLHRENSKISNNMDCLILQQGTPIIVAMMMGEFYICLTMYVEMFAHCAEGFHLCNSALRTNPNPLLVKTILFFCSHSNTGNFMLLEDLWPMQ